MARYFKSDNTAPVAPEILAAIGAANEGFAKGYGEDAWTYRLERRFCQLFEREVRVFPVATGTAANTLALASLVPPYGAILTHEEGHVVRDECGAPEFMTGGARLMLLQGRGAKLTAAAIDAAIVANPTSVHTVQPRALTLTQATELGTVYTPGELQALTSVAHAHGLAVHMDGARFANAVAHLGCAPADLTSRAGVDILSFGMTKNGGLLCDAIVVFDEALAGTIRWQIRRAGHVWSKGRFAAAQLLAYVEDDLWLRSARRSNALATRFDAGLRAIPGVGLWAPIQANEIFLRADAAVMDRLERSGIRFVRRAPDMARFVCRFDGTEAEIDALLAAVAKAAADA